MMHAGAPKIEVLIITGMKKQKLTKQLDARKMM
jgi:hypothetical protein